MHRLVRGLPRCLAIATFAAVLGAGAPGCAVEEASNAPRDEALPSAEPAAEEAALNDDVDTESEDGVADVADDDVDPTTDELELLPTLASDIDQSDLVAATARPEDGGDAAFAQPLALTKSVYTGRFRHPGILVTSEQLDYVKKKLAARAEPWTSAYLQMSSSKYAKLDWKPRPFVNVACGYHSNPATGCNEEKEDAAAAYTHALLWYLTRKPAHAEKAIQIMDAWSSTIKMHTLKNAPVQTSWIASMFPRAAELIRYTYPKWSPAAFKRFSTMLTTVYLPRIEHGSAANGNWEAGMIDGMMNIAVFTNDEALFAKAVSMWKKRLVAYLYLESDGPQPVRPPVKKSFTDETFIAFWHGQETYFDGLSQETCRDLVHTQMGVTALVNTAETARLHGVSLYIASGKGLGGVQIRAQDRLTRAFEVHARYLNGAKVPATLCGGKLHSVSTNSSWEIGYNHYAKRKGMDLPETKKLIARNRKRNTGASDTYGVSLMAAWETLTHGDVGFAR